MRITNSMMIKNTLNNINNNKTRMDELNSQLATKKKIQRPSEDPITAIRALRYRSTLSEISQYLERNIPDASSWMEITDDALENTEKLVEDIVAYSQQGANGVNDTSNRVILIETLKQYRDQIYSDANSDVAGRTIFTGYKTDETLTYKEDDSLAVFQIHQSFSSDDIQLLEVVTNSVDASGINAANLPVAVTADTPNLEKVPRLRLGYGNLSPTDFELQIGGVVVPAGDIVYTNSTSATAYTPGADEISFIEDTGEIIFGENYYLSASTSGDVSVSYVKEGFSKGELKPIHYFDCTDITDPVNPVSYTDSLQEINFTVNFNQTLKVNTEGKNVFTHNMTRDIDDLVKSVTTVKDIEDKILKLDSLRSTQTEGTPEYEALSELIDLANVELDYSKVNMQKSFERNISRFQEHQERVSLAKADNGARQKRLELNKERLTSQGSTVSVLKTQNEDADLASVAVEISEAGNVYDASLAAAAKVVQKSLLDFI